MSSAKVWAVGLLVLGLLVSIWGRRPEPGDHPFKVPDMDTDCRTFLDDAVHPTNVGSPPPGVLGRAQSRLESGARIFEDRNLSRRYLFDAISQWCEVVGMLEVWQDRPAEYYDALEKILEAEEELCVRYREARRAVDLAVTGHHLDTVLHYSTWIVESIPEPADPRYRWAKSTQLDVRRQILARDKSETLYGG